MNAKKLFSKIMIVFGLMSAWQTSNALVQTKEQYRDLIVQNRFAAGHISNISYAEKAVMFERIRNGYTMLSGETIREALLEMANGNVSLRAELEYICRISENRNDLLLNLNNVSEAYYGLTNIQRPESAVVIRARQFFNF